MSPALCLRPNRPLIAMKIAVRTAIAPLSLVGLFVLAGCATPRQDVASMLSVSRLVIYESRDPVFPVLLGADQREAWQIGARDYKETYPPVLVRECNTEMNDCSLGMAMVTSRTYLTNVKDGMATFAVQVALDIARSQTTSDQVTTITQSIPDEARAITKNVLFKKTVTLLIGERRRVDLGYGVSFSICATNVDAMLGPADARCDANPYLLKQKPISEAPLL